jgi:RNA polymerase sigma-70 factor (ECF subfamily)
MGVVARSLTTTLPLRVDDGTPASTNPDYALVDAVRRGDHAAFTTVVSRHQQTVFAYLRPRVLAAADVEDLCQEVFLRCFTSREQVRLSVRLRPWLIGIARNVLHEYVRRKTRCKEVAWTEMCLELESLAGHDEHAYDEALTHLPACLESLGPSARDALRLRYRGELRLAQIGRKMHRSEAAVKLLMFRARQALRCCLDRKLRLSSHE